MVPVTPVAYRAGRLEPWITDWSALHDSEQERRRCLDRAWEDFLGSEDVRLLEVMRFVRRGGRRERVGSLAARVTGESHRIYGLVDAGSFREVIAEDGRRTYQLAVGDRHPELIGELADYREAQEVVAAAIEHWRDQLAARLAAHGGLAAELAACRAHWPEPEIRYVPAATDVAADLRKLWRLHDDLRNERGDDWS